MRSKIALSESQILLICAVLIAVIFVIDVSTPRGYSGSFLYILPVFICLWSPKDRTIYGVAVIVTILTIIAVPIEPPGNQLVDLFNRPISIAGIWIVVLLGEQRRKSERKTEKYAKDLERSNAELRQFVYVASHDLQEPMRMVTAYLSLLESRYGDQLDGKAREYMDYAVEGGLRAKDLIADLLAYSRVESGSKEFTSVDMNATLSHALNNLSEAIASEHATIDADPLPTVMADDIQMVQLFQNLISNAIKYHSDRPPEVRITCLETEEEYTFSVQDNGIGLNTDYSDKIFQMFQRLHTRQEYPGTGIGLAISKKIVERHGGRIWVESEEGNGATFFFTIPVRRR